MRGFIYLVSSNSWTGSTKAQSQENPSLQNSRIKGLGEDGISLLYTEHNVLYHNKVDLKIYGGTSGGELVCEDFGCQ